MNKNSNRIATLIGVFVFVIGIIVLLSSTNIGISVAQSAINSNGGSMDTEKYYWIMQSSAVNYRIAGAILSIFGGVVTMFTMYKSIKW
ncbi:MAG: hypothetical protein R3Y12_06185 [Clostridia bacterium]